MTRQLARLAALPPGQALSRTVAVARLGDAVWVFTPGELYQVFQTTLRERFPDVAVVVATVTNDWQPGYLPAAASYGYGIYQEVIAAVAPGSLEALTAAVIRRDSTGFSRTRDRRPQHNRCHRHGGHREPAWISRAHLRSAGLLHYCDGCTSRPHRCPECPRCGIAPPPQSSPLRRPPRLGPGEQRLLPGRPAGQGGAGAAEPEDRVDRVHPGRGPARHAHPDPDDRRPDLRPDPHRAVDRRRRPDRHSSGPSNSATAGTRTPTRSPPTRSTSTSPTSPSCTRSTATPAWSSSSPTWARRRPPGWRPTRRACTASSGCGPATAARTGSTVYDLPRPIAIADAPKGPPDPNQPPVKDPKARQPGR